MKKPIPFGKYLLIDRVNVGGMAEVYKAKVTGVEGFERLVAIKRILPNIAEDDEFITMFIDEAKISVQLQHANIAQIYDLGKIGDSYFIAMEYISGKDVRAIFDRMRRRGEILPIPMTCYIISRLCEGLDYAHRKKDAAGRDLHIVHRDISPQNVLVSFEGEVKVIDFGIAKAANKASRTQAGILKGKFGYMSPEQVRGLPLDRRSDVFAVGVVLYELLTSERLFVGESDFSTLEKVRNVDVVPPSTYNRRIDDKLEAIVMKALAKDVDDRFQWCSDLQEALQRYLITSDSIFSRQDLSAFMKSAFAEDLEREKVRNQAALAASLGAPVGGALDATLDDIDIDEGEPDLSDRTEVFNPAGLAGTAPPPPPPAAMVGGGVSTHPGVAASTQPGAVPAGMHPPPGVGPLSGVPVGTQPGVPVGTQPGVPVGTQPGVPVGTQPGVPVGTQPGMVDAPTGVGPLPGVSPGARPGVSPEALQHGSTQPGAPLPPPRLPGSQPLGPDAIGGVPPALRPIDVPSDLRSVAQARRPIEERQPSVPTMEPRARRGGLGRTLGLIGAFVAVLGLGIGVALWLTQTAGTPKTGSLIIRGTPRRATVYLNGAPAGQIPFIDSRRAVGTYTIRVEHEGYEPFTTSTTVTEGDTATVDVTLTRAGNGMAQVLVVPVPLDAQVLFDGNLVKDGGDSPWRSEQVEAGKKHKVVVRKLGYREQVFEWTPEAGSLKTITAKLLPARGTLVVRSEPAGAEVTIDGKKRGKTPVTLRDLDTSVPISVTVSKGRCWEAQSERVIFEATETEKTLTLVLEKKPACGGSGTRHRTVRHGGGAAAAAPVGQGILRLNTRPVWSRVTIDGKDVGRTPLMNYELSAGKHTVIVEAPDGRKKTVPVVIRPDETTTKIVSYE